MGTTRVSQSEETWDFELSPSSSKGKSSRQVQNETPISETIKARRSVAHAAEFAGDPLHPET